MLFVPALVQATTITYEVGPAPYLEATFTDHAGGGVDLVMTAVNLPSPLFLGDWFFNVGIPNPSLLTFTFTGGVQATVSASSNGFHQGGGGDYDVSFSFPSGPPASRFQAGSFSSYLITGQNITAQDFEVLSGPRGGQPQYYTLAHIQGGDTGWASGSRATGGPVGPPGPGAPQGSPVPEPGPMGLMTVGAALLLAPRVIARLRR